MRPATLVFASLLAQMLACDGIGACTEVGCENRATVSIPPALVAGPFDLHVSDGLEMLTARCNDPDSEEAADNPPELSCDQAGFELAGHALANARSVRVTIIDVDSGDSPVANAEVFLDVVDTLRPNGAGCEPTCFVRNGQVLVSAED
jgi:hypothetical protein